MKSFLQLRWGGATTLANTVLLTDCWWFQAIETASSTEQVSLDHLRPQVTPLRSQEICETDEENPLKKHITWKGKKDLGNKTINLLILHGQRCCFSSLCTSSRCFSSHTSKVLAKTKIQVASGSHCGSPAQKLPLTSYHWRRRTKQFPQTVPNHSPWN